MRNGLHLSDDRTRFFLRKINERTYLLNIHTPVKQQSNTRRSSNWQIRNYTREYRRTMHVQIWTGNKGQGAIFTDLFFASSLQIRIITAMT